MRNLIMRIKKLIKEIEAEKGQDFKIKSLVANDLDNIQWDLVLSADWFANSNEMERLNYLAEKILKDFDTDCMVQFSGIITYEPNESNPLIERLTCIQNNNKLGKYADADAGGYVIVESRHETAKWIVPLNEPDNINAVSYFSTGIGEAVNVMFDAVLRLVENGKTKEEAEHIVKANFERVNKNPSLILNVDELCK